MVEMVLVVVDRMADDSSNEEEGGGGTNTVSVVVDRWGTDEDGVGAGIKTVFVVVDRPGLTLEIEVDERAIKLDEVMLDSNKEDAEPVGRGIGATTVNVDEAFWVTLVVSINDVKALEIADEALGISEMLETRLSLAGGGIGTTTVKVVVEVIVAKLDIVPEEAELVTPGTGTTTVGEEAEPESELLGIGTGMTTVTVDCDTEDVRLSEDVGTGAGG